MGGDMPRHMVKTVRTEVENKPEDPIQAALRLAIPNVVSLKMQGYVGALVNAGVPDLVVDVFKKKRALHGLSKVGEMAIAEIEPDSFEPWLFQSWGPGSYQLRPSVNGRYYSPASMLFKVGEDAPEDALPPSGATTPDDVDSIIAENVKRIGHVNVMSRLATIAKDFEGPKSEGEGDGMKTTDMLAMVQAMNAPLIAMLTASDARAARAEERADKLMERLTSGSGLGAAVKEPLFVELLKKAVDKPEALALLMGSPNGSGPEGEPGGGWPGLIKAALEQFAPVVQGFMAMQLQKAGMPVGPPAALSGGGGPSVEAGVEPLPTVAQPEGGSRMPIPLNEEQTMAKEYLLDFIKSGDLDNAFATLEAFPGFMPTADGPIPLGEALLSSIDPAANPRVYLPKLAMLLPEIITEKLGPIMTKFIAHVQGRLRTMQEQQAKAAAQAAEMRPTGREESA